jgi:hypothetical protein
MSEQKRSRPNGRGRLLQFKITLKDIKPPVWRRVQVRDVSLAGLHDVVQAVMGWEDCHLHRFEIDDVQYGRPDPDDDGFVSTFEDEAGMRLSDLLPTNGERKKFLYEYDFGDAWQHEVLFEGFPPPDPDISYPVCLEGARACPPEDVGGPPGYAEFLTVLSGSRGEWPEEFPEWLVGFDSEAFSVEEANERLRQMRRTSTRE